MEDSRPNVSLQTKASIAIPPARYFVGLFVDSIDFINYPFELREVSGKDVVGITF